MILPKGFKITSTSIGLKKSDDCALVFCDEPIVSASVFTQNVYAAAPVIVAKEKLAKSKNALQAILVNTASANACTGEIGIINAKKCANLVAENLNINPDKVIHLSTGKIGVQLDMDKFINGIPNLCKNFHNDIDKFGKAILTTDLAEKIEYKKIGNVNILGFTKGSGMIAPNMATMIAIVLTDANIEQSKLQTIWQKNCSETFNMLSVDDCESTNDSAIILASGKENIDEVEFEKGVFEIVKNLAKKIAADGEGATHLIEATAKNCATKNSAKILAKSVVKSDLLKSAVAGHDPNWGRICSAIGSTGEKFDGNKVDVFIDDICVFLQGVPQVVNNNSSMFQNKEVKINIDFHDGNFSATAWGCDLTEGYVKINARYST